MEAPKTRRGTWANHREFILSLLAFAVGYGNVWRFPYICYKNGGAAFLICYFVMNYCIGLPLYFMENVIGQYTSRAPVVLFSSLAPIFTGIGWGLLLFNFIVAINYFMIVSWAFFYFFASFSSPLPWSHCNNDFNSESCYSQAEAAICKNESLYYYNQTCISADDYCGLAHLLPYNSTHCLPFDGGPVLVANVLPRVTPTEDFFRNRMLGVKGMSWDNLGSMRWELVGCLALSSFIVACSIIKGIKSLGKVVYVSSTLPLVILIIMFIRGITLDGFYDGIEIYILKPNLTKLTEMEVWSDAANQIFYSTGVAYGVIITLASYNQFNNNCLRDAVTVNTLNASASIFAGFVIFSVLGFLAKELGVEIPDVTSSGSGLVFVVYPAALALLPLPQLWSVLFFFMLINLGVGTQISAVEAIATALYDQFEFLRPKKALVSFSICLLLFLLSLTQCLEGGVYMFELFFWYSAGFGVFILAMSQLFAIQFFYGYKNFLKMTEEMGIKIPCVFQYYFGFAYIIAIPLVISVLAFLNVYYAVPAYWGDYVFPESIQILGWLMSIAGASCIPFAAVVIFIMKKGKWKELLKTSKDFCPASRREAGQIILENTSDRVFVEKFQYTYDNPVLQIDTNQEITLYSRQSFSTD